MSLALCGFHGGLFGGLAIRLQLTDELQVFFHAALNPAFVEGEELQVLGFLAPGAGEAQGVLKIGILRADGE